MNKEILRLAIPNILSNVSVPLLSTVDTALMGHLSQAHLGAVGLGAMVFNLIYWNFGFLRMGTTGMTAQAFGAGDGPEISRLLGRSLLVALTIAFLLILFQGPFDRLGIWFFQVDSEQIALVSTYFRIRIWAAPATLLSYVVFGWLFGMQNAFIPLVLTVVANIINIILSYVLVQYYDLGIAGAAWGTVVAQYTGILLAFVFLRLKYMSYVREMGNNLLDHAESLIKFFSINRDLFIRTLCLTLAFAFFYRHSSVMGATILAVNVVLLQLINWMSYGIDGFAYAAESLVGKYKGARNYNRGNKAIKHVMLWGLVLALTFSLTYAIWSIPIFRIFTDQLPVIEASEPYLWYMAAFPLAGFICYIWDGIYIGLTASVTMRNAMLLSLIIYVGVYYSLRSIAPVHALWIALLLFLLGRGIIQSLYFYRYGWNIP
ncbi:MAG: MATE family efflux transporter [Saprospiraceae bacterium]|nr:MATE family efflux transporter [Saprospiraceae bacterium]